MKTPDYILPLVAAFKMHADPANAIQMKKYMKDKFAFYGIHSPLRKEIYKAHKNQHGLIPEKQRMEIVSWCWQAPLSVNTSILRWNSWVKSKKKYSRK